MGGKRKICQKCQIKIPEGAWYCIRHKDYCLDCGLKIRLEDIAKEQQTLESNKSRSETPQKSKSKSDNKARTQKQEPHKQSTEQDPPPQSQKSNGPKK